MGLEREGGMITCPACEEEQMDEDCLLGALGSRCWFRCRYCGWEWSASRVDAESKEESEEESEEEMA